MPLLPKPHPRSLGLRDFLPPFLLGFVATCSQILLLREFNAYFYGNELTFGLVLASWLLWGGLGSLFASRWRFKSKNLARVYYGVILFLGLSLGGLRMSRFLWSILPGEVAGMTPVLALSLGLCLLVSLPLGALFVLNVERMGGNLSGVYILESLGAGAAGLVVYFLFLPWLSTWQSAALVGVAAGFLIFFSMGEKRNVLTLPLGLLFLVGLVVLDWPSQKLYWKPYHLLASRDSRYGRLQVIQTEEQISLYSNNSPVYSYPDPATAEESVHFALLQNPGAEKVLLIGGGAGGTLREILKYPRAQVDYVELDPMIIRLSERFLPEEEKKTLTDSRVHLFFQDGRAFLRKKQGGYDSIILSLPDPSTAQINRFYTRDFFVLAKKKLTWGGIFSFVVSSSEEYIGEEQRLFLSSLYHSLAAVFSHVEVIPGTRNIFLASSQPLLTTAEEFTKRIKALGLSTLFVTPPFLASRLHPLRRDRLEKGLKMGGGRINTDLSPISFYFQIVLWSRHFRGIEAQVLKFFSALPSSWLLGLPLAFFFLVLVFFALKQKRKYDSLIPLVVMGFTSIVTEVIVLIWFQALYGYLYGAVAFLFALFMFGLFCGSWASTKRKGQSYRHLIFIQAAFLFVLLILRAAMAAKPPEAMAFLILFAFGYLAGDLFIIANRLYLEHKADYGVGYGLDLLGSFGGALVTSAVLIPLAGLPALLGSVFLANLFCLLFLLVRSTLDKCC
ncbi:MAG: fused MFS/spermidine synthase [Candidatus Aminicenantales bacterium]